MSEPYLQYPYIQEKRMFIFCFVCLRTTHKAPPERYLLRKVIFPHQTSQDFLVTLMELQLILSENQEILTIVILYVQQSVAKHLVPVGIHYKCLQGFAGFQQVFSAISVIITEKPYTPQKERLCMMWGSSVTFTNCGENPMITIFFFEETVLFE